jgi:hypothetical protein
VFKGHRITVMLAPSRLEVALVSSSGHIVASHGVMLNPSDWSTGWEEGLLNFDQPLNAALRAVNAPKACPAEVIYIGSTETVDIRTYDSQTQHPQLLAESTVLAELSYEREHAVVAGKILTTPSGNNQQVVLTVADRDDQLRLLFAWLSRAGLSPQSATPMQAIVLSQLVSRALKADHGQDTTLLYLGEHSTVLLASSPNATDVPELKFIRSLSFGFDALVEAIERAVQRELQESSSSKLDLERGRRILLTSGIPTPEQMVDPEISVVGRAILPLLQPVLQRYAVETRQTLRFGLQSSRYGKITAVGAGAHIPRFVEILSNFLDTEIVACIAAARENPVQACADGSESRHWLEQGDRPVLLMPRSQAMRRQSRQLSTAIRIGAVAACAVLAFSAADAWKTHLGIQQQIEAFRPQVDRVRQVAELETHSAQLGMKVNSAEHAMYSTIDRSPDWGGLLIELGFLCDERIRLLAINSDVKDGTTSIELHGIAVEDNIPDAKSSMAVFLERLGYSPLLSDVRLESTRSSEYEGSPVRRFVIRAQAVAVPASYLLGENAAKGKGGGS